MEKDDIEKTDQTETFLIIKGKFKYGKYDDEIGIFMGIIGNEELKSWYLVSTNNFEIQSISVDVNYVLFKRIFDENSLKERQRSYELKEQLKELIKNNLLTESNLTPEKLEEFFTDQLQNIIKEELDLDLGVESIDKKELESNLPHLFVDNNEKEEVVKEEPEENQTIIIDCSLFVSPIRGQEIGSFGPGDKIIVSVSDSNYAELKSIKSELVVDSANNKLQGVVKEVNHNPEENIYGFLIEFASEFYGESIVEANSNIRLEVPDQDEEVDFEEYEPVYENLFNYLLIILGIELLVLIFINLF